MSIHLLLNILVVTLSICLLLACFVARRAIAEVKYLEARNTQQRDEIEKIERDRYRVKLESTENVRNLGLITRAVGRVGFTYTNATEEIISQYKKRGAVLIKLHREFSNRTVRKWHEARVIEQCLADSPEEKELEKVPEAA